MGCWGCLTTILLIYLVYFLLVEVLGMGSFIAFFVALAVVFLFSSMINRKRFEYYIRVNRGTMQSGPRGAGSSSRKRDSLGSQEGQETLVSVDCPSCGEYICHAVPGSRVKCQNCGENTRAGD